MANVVKPTPSEQSIIDKRLLRQYPQMYEAGWGNVALGRELATLRAKAVAKVIKKKKQTPEPSGRRYSTRDEDVEARLKKAGLTEEQIEKLSGRKRE